MAYKIANVDWAVFLAALADEKEQGDMAVVDFPFENAQRERGSQPRLKKWFPMLPFETLQDVLHAVYACLKPATHCYVFVPNWRQLDEIAKMCELAGFSVDNRLVWDQVYKGMGYSWRDSHTDMLFLRKGRRALNHSGGRDVLTYPKITSGYPTEKPVGLAEEMILNSTDPGEIVVDPFMGSGVFAQTAIRNGRRFRGTDISQEAYDMAIDRAYSAVYELSKFVHTWGIEREQVIVEGEDPPVSLKKDRHRAYKLGKKPPVNTRHLGAKGKQ